jgi:hypothetical protein
MHESLYMILRAATCTQYIGLYYHIVIIQRTLFLRELYTD